MPGDCWCYLALNQARFCQSFLYIDLSMTVGMQQLQVVGRVLERLGCARYDGGRASLPTLNLLIQAPDHFSCRQAARAVDRFLDLAMNLQEGPARNNRIEQIDRHHRPGKTSRVRRINRQRRSFDRRPPAGSVGAKPKRDARKPSVPHFCAKTQVIVQQRIRKGGDARGRKNAKSRTLQEPASEEADRSGRLPFPRFSVGKETAMR